MDDWSRRRWLSALGCGAASTIAWACGGGRGRGVARPVDELEDLGARLVGEGARVADEFRRGAVQVVAHRHVVASADASGAVIRDEVTTRALARGQDAHGRFRERATSGASREAIAALVDGLLGGRRAAAARGDELAVPSTAANHRRYTGADDPALAPATAWLDRAIALRTRADAAGSSRIVYRAGFVELDDTEVWCADRTGLRRQRLVRARAGVLLVAWTGGRPVHAVAEVAAPIGLDIAARLDDAAIARAAQRALEPLTPGEGPSGDTAVVLDPSVVAALVDRGLVPRLTRGGDPREPDWQLAAAIEITDDARAASYGGYAFDDDGQPAAALALVRGGARVGLLGGTDVAPAQQRRPGHIGGARSAAAHLVIAPGEHDVEALIAGIDKGYLLEDAGAAQLDRARWELAVPVARARRIEHGQRTGHVYGDLELRGAVPALLGGVTAVSRDVGAIAWRDEEAELPLWRSAQAPWCATRGALVARS
ncbi:MAG: hypothetical protein K8W52_08380 [Deltaproteobacteria bacterium]|nr:hypothetical protein [Deltaproteobacteria bacterium]